MPPTLPPSARKMKIYLGASSAVAEDAPASASATATTQRISGGRSFIGGRRSVFGAAYAYGDMDARQRKRQGLSRPGCHSAVDKIFDGEFLYMAAVLMFGVIRKYRVV